MEMHFLHLTNEIHTTPKQRRFYTPRRLLIATVAPVLCSAGVILAACNVGDSGY